MINMNIIFFNIQGGALSCDSSKVECYVIDNNGFVVISEDPLNTGKFFGEIDGTVLNSLVQNQVFKKIKVYDYQVIVILNLRKTKMIFQHTTQGTMLFCFIIANATNITIRDSTVCSNISYN